MTNQKRDYENFYGKLQKEVEMFLDTDGVYKIKEGDNWEKIKEYLMVIPHFFLLIYNLFVDKRVPIENKAILGMALAYFLLPLDFFPELFLGPIGYLDDLVVGVMALNTILNQTPVEVVLENWQGERDILLLMREIIYNSNSFFSEKVLKRIRSLFSKKL